MYWSWNVTVAGVDAGCGVFDAIVTQPSDSRGVGSFWPAVLVVNATVGAGAGVSVSESFASVISRGFGCALLFSSVEDSTSVSGHCCCPEMVACSLNQRELAGNVSA